MTKDKQQLRTSSERSPLLQTDEKAATVCETMATNPHRPIIILGIGLIVNIAVLSWLAWDDFNSHYETQRASERGRRIERLRGRILHLDEVLTMSARMAAATGDQRWEQRYRKFEPKLDVAIKEAMQIVPSAAASEAAGKTDQANQKLVAMENRSFDLVRQGKADEAKAVLFSKEYEAQKQIYSEGMHDLAAWLSEAISKDLAEEDHHARVHVAAAVVLIAMVMGAWFVMLRATYKWQRTLTRNNRRLSGQATEFAELNRTLDQKVAERTRDLDERIKELSCMYEVSHSINNRKTLTDIFRDVAEIIPSSWQYPEIARGRVVFDGLEYVSEPFEPTAWKQSSDIVVDGQSRGAVEVYYLEPRPESDEGPFMKEERRLIDALSDTLTQAIARKAQQNDSARLAAAMEQATETIVISNLDEKIEYVNPAFERTTGYTLAEVVGCNPDIFKSGQHDEKFLRNLWDTPARGEVWRGNLANQRKDGTLYEEEATISPVRDYEGKIFCYVSVGRNVTHEKNLQSELKDARQLKAIGQLASGIAHEINTPTQYVGDNTRFLDESFNKLLPLLEQYGHLLAEVKRGAVTEELVAKTERATEQADLEYLVEEIPLAIQQSVDGISRVADIVRAMKEFARPGVNTTAPTDINKALDSTIAISCNEWKYAAEIETDYDASLPSVLCLPGEINQVFLDLIINAAQAIADVAGDDSQQKGMIRVSTRRDGDWVEIRISDTGAGIPPEIRDKIFDPFFTTREVGKGIGQGLARARAIMVEGHRGTITFETEIDKGTTFTVRLPVAGHTDQEEVRERETADVN